MHFRDLRIADREPDDTSNYVYLRLSDFLTEVYNKRRGMSFNLIKRWTIAFSLS